jgi:ABC-2 type transport system ATP-binding protein
MIAVEGVSKSYGGTGFAIRDVSFEVARGEVVGFVGPNGAGKTTTLRIVAGFLGATSGRVVLGGHDVAEQPLAARALVGYMAEGVPVYPEMRVREYLRYRCELKGTARRRRRSCVERAMALANVEQVADVLIGHLSKGYRQRVGLADALVSEPPILVLDEPTSGLDPNQIRETRALVRDLGKQSAVLLSTHILSEVEATCDRAIVIAQGALVAQGTFAELREMRRSRSLRVVLGARPSDEVLKGLERRADIAAVAVEDATVTIRWNKEVEDTGRAAEEASRFVVEAGCSLREMTPIVASLEEVFAALTLERRDS